jgi:O-antigen/teichoic acid export membrane protein
MSRRPTLARSLPPVYGAAALRLAFPVLLLPIMAARLGADDFGQLSLLLVWAALLSTLVEGGFLAAATRLAVVADAPRRWALARQVFSARVVWSAVVALLAVAVVATLLRPASLAEGAAAAALLAVAACALGWQATWYLQASEQLHRWAWVEITVYALWALAVLLLGHSVLGYLLLQALATSALAATGWWWLHRQLAQRQPLWQASAVRPGLRLGWTMLPVAVAGAAYSYALPAVASSQMARAELGVYFLADRLVRAMLSAAEPVFQVVFPRIVARIATAGARAALAYTAKWAAIGALAGALLLAAGVLLWPWAQPWLAGARGGFDAARAAPVMATLGLLLPVLLCWKFFGYWLLGSGRFDHAYRACMLLGGVAGVAGAWGFGGQGALALSRVAVAVELFVIAAAVLGMLITQYWARSGRAEVG